MNFELEPCELSSFEIIQSRLTETAWSGKKIVTKIARRPPVKELRANEESLITAFQLLEKWYEKSSKGFKKDEFQGKIGILYRLFGYAPYTGRLFRALPSGVIAKHKEDKLEEDKVYRIKKASPGDLSSWTTSISNAMTFGSDQVDIFGIIELLGKATQLSNSAYLSVIVEYLNERLNSKSQLFKAANDLRGTLRQYIQEDEVIMFVPENTKVRLVAFSSPYYPVRRRE